MTTSFDENNQFKRVEQLLGTNGLAHIQNSFVIVMGLGAVGGYVTEALARSGVGRIRLVDHDVIKPSNLNRQILATWNTIGQKKSETAKKRVLDINPNCVVDARDTFIHVNTLEELLDGSPDIVVDAIDSMNPKIELLSELLNRNQTAISSMGAALRVDPSRIRIGQISEITHCPLAALVRKRLRRRGFDPKIPCVYSNEETRYLHRGAVFPPEQFDTHADEKGRRRTSLGSLPTITGIFGLMIANWVLMHLSNGGNDSVNVKADFV
ncbi:MAG: tRNA threonylcarbamoyladenosine dehydratase [Thermoguttaceae bacterium]